VLDAAARNAEVAGLDFDLDEALDRRRSGLTGAGDRRTRRPIPVLVGGVIGSSSNLRAGARQGDRRRVEPAGVAIVHEVLEGLGLHRSPKGAVVWIASQLRKVKGLRCGVNAGETHDVVRVVGKENLEAGLSEIALSRNVGILVLDGAANDIDCLGGAAADGNDAKIELASAGDAVTKISAIVSATQRDGWPTGIDRGTDGANQAAFAVAERTCRGAIKDIHGTTVASSGGGETVGEVGANHILEGGDAVCEREAAAGRHEQVTVRMCTATEVEDGTREETEVGVREHTELKH